MHSPVPDPSPESLSTRILGDPCTPAWLELFTHSAAAQHIRFESLTATVLCTHRTTRGDATHEVMDEDLLRIAHANGAECDVPEAGIALMLFLSPTRAFDAARQIQELPGGQRLRIGLAAGACETAWVEIRAGVRKFHLGEAVERAQSISALAPAGTIRMCPELSVHLQPKVDALADRLVTTEIDDHGVATVSLALPPRPTDLLSSFAGLGLV